MFDVENWLNYIAGVFSLLGDVLTEVVYMVAVLGTGSTSTGGKPRYLPPYIVDENIRIYSPKVDSH